MTPKVIMVMAISVDGHIAKHHSEFTNWTSREDKQLFAKLSKECGVVMMGENTFKTFPAPLPNRLNFVFSENPPHSSDPLVQYFSGPPEEALAILSQQGFTQVLLGGGTFLNSLFLEHNLIDELIITIEPKLFGQGLDLFKLEQEKELKLLACQKLNENTIKLHYQVIK